MGNFKSEILMRIVTIYVFVHVTSIDYILKNKIKLYQIGSEPMLDLGPSTIKYIHTYVSKYLNNLILENLGNYVNMYKLIYYSIIIKMVLILRSIATTK